MIITCPGSLASQDIPWLAAIIVAFLPDGEMLARGNSDLGVQLVT